MTDITGTFVELLKKHDVASIGGPWRPSEDSDAFLKEAYRIYSHISSLRTYLHSIRQPYLSVSQPFRRRDGTSIKAPHLADGGNRQSLNEHQRDQIDAESKQLLRDVNRAVQNLAEAERLRQKAESTLAQRKRAPGRFGGLKIWAAGGSETGKTPIEEVEDARVSTLNAHRESVLWYLRRHLEICSERQMTMMEIRLTREMEKSKSRLYEAHGPALMAATSMATSSGNAKVAGGTGKGLQASNLDLADGVSSDDDSGDRLTQEQQQLLAEENQDMLKHFEDTLDQVRTAERSLLEISELQTTLANNLAVQTAHIDQLVADTLYTTENVGGGNKQLKKATERRRTAKYVFYGSCAFSLVLIAYDLLI